MRDPTSDPRAAVAADLARAGCVAPHAEADELIRAATAGAGPLATLVARRVRGEPLAWITGSTSFGGLRIAVDPGVFEPRPLSEVLAERAASRLPADGIAIDLCTGSGAVAAVLADRHPGATVLATDIDPTAVACARRNGVAARLGDLFEPVPDDLRGRVDLVTAVTPYVPSDELHLLPRDVQAYEPRVALDGGAEGLAVSRRVVDDAGRWLRPGGVLLFEVGGDQAASLASHLAAAGFGVVDVHDDDGWPRIVEAVLEPAEGRPEDTSPPPSAS